MTNRVGRRQFVRDVALGSAAVSLGWPRHLAWSMPMTGIRPLRIVYYTDIHARREWDTPVAMMQAARAMNRTTADMVICGGDMITDGFQSHASDVAHRWDVYMDMHRAIQPRPHAAIGNHDLVAANPEDGSPPAANPRAPFLERLGLTKSYRTFEANGVRFFFLDPFEIVGGALQYRGFIDDAQQAWIRRTLEQVDPGTPIVVVCHMPLMTLFYQATGGAMAAAPENRVVVNSRDVLDLFADHTLALVLQGHLHVNEIMRWKNTTFVTGGAVCGKWWRGSWKGTPEGFGAIEFRDNRVVWTYHAYGWEARRPEHQ